MHFRIHSAIARSRGLLGAGLCVSVLSCAQASPFEGMAAHTQNIVAGEASGADQDGVVLLRAVLEDGGDLLCSASLVGPNLIATARHCVAYLSDGEFACSVRGEPIENPSGGGRLGLHLPAASLEIYGRKTPRKVPLAHGLRVVSTLSPTICRNDLAFVVLDRALDLPIVPLRIGQPAARHESALLIGYGLDGEQQVLDYRSQTRQQKRDLEIAAVGPDSLSDGVTTVSPRTLILEGPAGCVGDSGGPLLAQATGALLGVVSLLQGESCAMADARNQLTHVPPFQTLIDEAFAAAGCEPVLEDTPSTGAGGDAGAPAATPSETGTAGEPSGAGGALAAPSAAGAPTTTPAEASRAHDSSCGFAEPAGDVPTGAHLLALLGATLCRRRREPRASG